MPDEFASIGISNVDRGVVTSFGGELVDVEIDGEVRQAYAVQIENLAEYPDSPGYTEQLRPLPAYPTGYIPIFFTYPEEVFQPFVLPCVVIRRGGINPNFGRAPFWGFTTKPVNGAPLAHAVIDGQVVSGPSQTVTQADPVPFDFSYEVVTMARLMNDEIKILQAMLRIARPPYFRVDITDSLGNVHGTDAGPVSVADMSELVDVSDRTLSHAISFDVWGCLTLDDPTESQTVVGLPEVTLEPFRPDPEPTKRLRPFSNTLAVQESDEMGPVDSVIRSDRP